MQGLNRRQLVRFRFLYKYILLIFLRLILSFLLLLSVPGVKLQLFQSSNSLSFSFLEIKKRQFVFLLELFSLILNNFLPSKDKFLTSGKNGFVNSRECYTVKFYSWCQFVFFNFLQTCICLKIKVQIRTMMINPLYVLQHVFCSLGWFGSCPALVVVFSHAPEQQVLTLLQYSRFQPCSSSWF